MARTLKGTSYEVVSPRGTHGLVTRAETLDDIIEETRSIEERAKAQGYKPNRWFITKDEWTRSWNDDDEFTGETHNVSVVCKINERGEIE